MGQEPRGRETQHQRLQPAAKQESRDLQRQRDAVAGGKAKNVNPQNHDGSGGDRMGSGSEG